MVVSAKHLMNKFQKSHHFMAEFMIFSKNYGGKYQGKSGKYPGKSGKKPVVRFGISFVASLVKVHLNPG